MKLLVAPVMLTRPCSLFESRRIPAAPSATRNSFSSWRNCIILAKSRIRRIMAAMGDAGPGLLGRGLDRDRLLEDPGPLELPLVGRQLLGSTRP